MVKGTILVVEDNPDDEFLTLRALRNNRIGDRIVVARDGAEAVARAVGTPESPPDVAPGLVLLDLKLPKLDGIEVLRAFRADPRMSLVPVVILTTSAEEHGIAEAYRCGANSYVRKPVDFEQFNEVVRNLGRYWLVINEAARPGAVR